MESETMPIKSLLHTCAITLSLCLLGAGCAYSQQPNPDFSIGITTVAGADYPSLRVTGHIAVNLQLDAIRPDASGNTLRYYVRDAIKNGWNCFDPKNYSVTYTLPGNKTEHSVQLASVTGNFACNAGYDLQVVNLWLNDPVNFKSSYKVELKGIDSKTNKNIWSAAKQFPSSSRPVMISATPQSISNEPLSTGTYKTVEQVALSATVPIAATQAKQTGAYLVSNDVISSNERDNKSAFLGGAGFEYDPRRWYAPIKLEADVQGNQVATNLSTIASASVSTAVPWGGTGKLLDNPLFGFPLSPTLSLALPYTHRINQVVSAKGTPLPVNDFSLNPALALANGTLLKSLCNPNSPNKSILCFGLSMDLGFYYLPLEKTSAGNQRVDGYGDVSFFIPITNFQKPLQLVTFSSQTLQSEFQIEYCDSVSPANNYARTKKWSFGVVLIK